MATWLLLLQAESDRGAAIMAAALVENILQMVICTRIVNPGATVQGLWFEGPNAPFASFAAKIKLGRAVAIYGEHMEKRLGVIKDIRNAFAHRSLPLDFTHPTLIASCLKLSPRPEQHITRSMRSVFCASCISLANMLIEDAEKHAEKDMAISFP